LERKNWIDLKNYKEMQIMVDKKNRKITETLKYLNSWSKTFKGGLTILSVILMSILPLASQRTDILGLFINIMIFTIFAGSWDFLAGFTGQVSFGHSIFFGIASYGVSYFIVYLNFVWWISLIIGVCIAILAGLLIGIPCLRLKGPYLALGTLSFSFILLSLFSMGELKDIFWSTEGITGVTPISENILIVYYVNLIFVIASLIIMIQIGKSNFGTILKSIRDDERSSEASGINISKYKIYAFMISALFAGIAGTLYALKNRGTNPSGAYGSIISFYAIIMASIGGIGTIAGSALGAFLFWFLDEFLKYIITDPSLAAMSVLIFATILIIIIRFAEQGIMKPLIERLKDLWDLLIGR
jgi:branched-chain amino acid transport system permease protein